MFNPTIMGRFTDALGAIASSVGGSVDASLRIGHLSFEISKLFNDTPNAITSIPFPFAHSTLNVNVHGAPSREAIEAKAPALLAAIGKEVAEWSARSLAATAAIEVGVHWIHEADSIEDLAGKHPKFYAMLTKAGFRADDYPLTLARAA